MSICSFIQETTDPLSVGHTQGWGYSHETGLCSHRPRTLVGTQAGDKQGDTRGHKGDTRGHKGTHDMSEASMLWRIRVGSVGFGKLFFEWIIKKNLFIYF